MSQIDRIAMSTGWQPSDWHRALCKTMSPNAVYGLFREADYTPQRRTLTFKHRHLCDLALRHHERAITEALGAVVMVSADSGG